MSCEQSSRFFEILFHWINCFTLPDSSCWSLRLYLSKIISRNNRTATHFTFQEQSVHLTPNHPSLCWNVSLLENTDRKKQKKKKKTNWNYYWNHKKYILWSCVEELNWDTMVIYFLGFAPPSKRIPAALWSGCKFSFNYKLNNRTLSELFTTVKKRFTVF